MLAPKRPTETHLSLPVAASVRPSPAPQSSRPRPAAQTGPERPPTNHRPANHLVVRCAGAAACSMSGWTGGSNPGPSCLPAALPRRLRLACWCSSATPSEPFLLPTCKLAKTRYYATVPRCGPDRFSASQRCGPTRVGSRFDSVQLWFLESDRRRTRCWGIIAKSRVFLLLHGLLIHSNTRSSYTISSSHRYQYKVLNQVISGTDRYSKVSTITRTILDRESSQDFNCT